MKKLLFNNPKFIKSALKPKDYPVLRDESGDILPEVAVAGRSNVGKSSLINHLFQVKGMAKTSSTPGKTQLLNFFTVDDILAFVDLPGYGYAKVPDQVRREWGPLIENYLKDREHLELILFLFDIRREPTEEDLQLIDWINFYQKSVVLILTKVDKVKKGECASNTQKILNGLGIKNLDYIHYSVTHNIGRPQLIGILKKVVQQNEKFS
jgi:GTP-binding protein